MIPNYKHPLEIVVELDTVELSVLPIRPLDELIAGHQGSAELVSGKEWDISQLPASQRFHVGGEGIPDGFAEQPFTQKPVYLHSVRDAYVFPKYGVIMTRTGQAFRDPMGEAKYFTPDLAALPFMQKRGDSTVFCPPDRVETLDRVVVTMPMGATGNYGHFLLDCLPGIAVTKNIGLPEDFRYIFPKLKHWHYDHLFRQGVKVLILEDPDDELVYYCDHVLFTSCMDHNLHWPNEHFRLIAKSENTEAPTRSVYLSRANQKRKFVTESHIEAKLSERGFEVVRPEELSTKDQIKLFEQSKIIVGPTGAGFANVLFCKPGTIVVEIQPRGMHNIWVRNLCILLGLRWMPYFCNSTILNPDHPEAGMEFSVHTGDLTAFIAAALE